MSGFVNWVRVKQETPHWWVFWTVLCLVGLAAAIHLDDHLWMVVNAWAAGACFAYMVETWSKQAGAPQDVYRPALVLEKGDWEARGYCDNGPCLNIATREWNPFCSERCYDEHAHTMMRREKREDPNW